MKVIFVAGIHAVGKSSACKFLSSETGIPHYTASQIIREEKASKKNFGGSGVTSGNLNKGIKNAKRFSKA